MSLILQVVMAVILWNLLFPVILEPIVIELRRIAPELKGGILAHVSDAPWSFPPVSIEENDEQLVVFGQHGRLIGAGYWLDNVLDKLNNTYFLGAK